MMKSSVEDKVNFLTFNQKVKAQTLIESCLRLIISSEQLVYVVPSKSIFNNHKVSFGKEIQKQPDRE